MTKEQSELLSDVLSYARHPGCGVCFKFPATIEQMIDAKMASLKSKSEYFEAHIDEECCKSMYYDLQQEIAALEELKTIMEGK